MKKIIIILGTVAVICIAAIGIMYLPKRTVDAESSSTTNWSENTVPAQTAPDTSSNEIKLYGDLEVDDTYILKDQVLNLNSHTVTVTSNGFIELNNSTIYGGIIRIVGQYTEEHIVNVYGNSKIDNCLFVVSGEANVLYIIYTDEQSTLWLTNCIFNALQCEVDTLRVVGANGEIITTNCSFNFEKPNEEYDWVSFYVSGAI